MLCCILKDYSYICSQNACNKRTALLYHCYMTGHTFVHFEALFCIILPICLVVSIEKCNFAELNFIEKCSF
jgi:hypothetical protein